MFKEKNVDIILIKRCNSDEILGNYGYSWSLQDIYTSTVDH